MQSLFILTHCTLSMVSVELDIKDLYLKCMHFLVVILIEGEGIPNDLHAKCAGALKYV